MTASAPSSAFGAAKGAAAFADLDGDGFLDIVSSATNTEVSETGALVSIFQDSQMIDATDSMSIATQDSAIDLLEILDGALSQLSAQRSEPGAPCKSF